LPPDVSVLVVDDGSIDGTADLVRARSEPELSVITVPHGGKGGAARAGMLHANADMILFADADMATPPDMIALIVAALADHDVALGRPNQPKGVEMATDR